MNYYFFKITTEDAGTICGTTYCEEQDLELKLTQVVDYAAVTPTSYEAALIGPETYYITI